MGLAGLFMERSARRDFTGIFSLIVLSYVLAPFQAWAALKGLIEKREGVWFRTPKTGRITELIMKIRLRKVLRWILPGERRRSRPERKKVGGKKPPGVALTLLIVMSTMIGGITFLSSTVSVAAQETGPAALTFEYAEDPVTVCGVTTNRYLTHPDWTGLGATPRTDWWTATDAGWHEVWNFYLFRPLEQDYTITGRIVYYVYFYVSDDENEEASFRFVIYDVDTNGKSKRVHQDTFWSIELEEESPEDPIELEGKDIRRPYTFLAGHTIRVSIWIKSKPPFPTTYYFDNDYTSKQSYTDFHGIVVPENALPLMVLAPIIPLLMYNWRKRRRRL